MKKYNVRQIQKIQNEVTYSKIIAVTGKMATGKNFVCSLLEQFGWQSIDADLLVHKIIEQSAKEIYNTFNKDAQAQNINILQNNDLSNPIINRRELGKLLFDKPQLLLKQEQIIYPKLISIIKEQTLNNKIIINATLLYKTPELLQLCDKIIYVKSSFIKRIFRTKKRDNLPFKQIIQRFNTQKNLYKKYKNFSNLIIINN